MKWILIAVFVMTNDGAGFKGGSGYKGFAFQEFDSQQACENAILRSTKLAQSLDGTDAARNPSYRLECVPK